MAYRHGVYGSELATSVLPPVTVDAGIPMIVGTAPVGMASSPSVNAPVLCSTYAEAVAAFGYVPPADDGTGLKKYAYSISEFVYSQFALFGVAPVIIVNVLDPDKHRKSGIVATVTISAATGEGTVAETGVIPSTFVLTSADDDEPVTYVRGTDYDVAFDDDGNLVVSSLTDDDGAFLLPTATALPVSYQVTDPTAVTSADIIGGVSSTGVKKGWELIDDVYPRFGVIPGTLVSPGYSSDSGVAAVMAAKCTGINGLFRAVSIVDIPTDTVKIYTAAPEWKDSNNIASTSQIACWPMLALSGAAFHMSSQLAPLIALTDSDNGDVPYVSPSNHLFQADSTVLADASEVWLNNETASYLNGQGIVTAQNFIGGWKCWGNRCACYPANTDAKDAFIPVRRMFNWVVNTLITTFWSKVDAPMNKRLVQTVVDSANIWLNGLHARQYILGGRVEFDEAENPATSLLDGKMTFHVYITPPTPAHEIDFALEYDVDNLATLFSD